jgi:hypothetical protein
VGVDDMERFKWSTYDGKLVLHQDFSGLSKSELINHFQESHFRIRNKGCRDLIVITNIRNIKIDKNTSIEFENLAKYNKTFIKESAVYGVGPLQKVALESVGRLTGRRFSVFREETEAQDWIRQLKLNEKQLAKS